MKPCFGYIRVSSQKQGEGVSLEAQKDAITEFASRENLEIIRWFEEKETAAKTGRRVFNDMIRELKRGRAAGLIIHRIDRSARNFLDWGRIGELSDKGIDVYFATESLDFRSRGGRLVADIQMAVAADYCRNLSIEARKGINGRLKQGLYPFYAPLGYENQGGGKLKTTDPLRAPLIKQLFNLYLTGDHSIRSLHAEMVKRGLTTRGGKPVSRRTIENILQNRFYCGLTQNGRTGEVFQGKHKPLISVADFARIKAIKEGRYTKKKTKHDHLLRKLFRCGGSGTLLTPERQKGHVYYRCHTAGCVKQTAREELLDAAVFQGLGQLQFTDEDVETMRAKYETWDMPARLEEERQNLKLRLADAKDRLDRLTDFLLDGTLDREAYARRRETLQIEIAGLNEDLRNLKERDVSAEDIEKFFELMKSLAALYASAKPPAKRGIIENCFSNRTWTGSQVELEPSDRLVRAKTDMLAPSGGGTRDTFRALIEIFYPNDISG
ncbi:recombinase family protein [Aliiruegeria sabulilitoris]|uniref:recombinase family protein n=1 Tax=Aliiruegeria sabulilitoris TaxID=1510458 RepID=UPI0009EC1199|nr:recombinase family protein [Aliiruegeria sabulilitoris]NDR57648.1 recombinase family protein [Pseudoruegeria sp. M32A2M]